MLGVWLIGAVFLGGAGVYALTMRSPSWFRSDIADMAESRRIAQRLENRLISEAYRFRGAPTTGADGVRRTGEGWVVRVTEEEARAWLTTKLGEWLANRDPPIRMTREISELQAHFGSGRAWLAGRFEERVYTVSSGIGVRESGVWLTGVRAGLGSLSLPIAWGGAGLIGIDGLEGGGWIWKAATGREPLLAGGTIRLEDGRRVRVVGVQVLPGVLEVECRTEVP